MRPVPGVTAALLALAATLLSAPQRATVPAPLQLTGYADPQSVEPGQTVRFRVTSEYPRYRADIVRLVLGDVHPRSPGFKEQLIETAVAREYPGRRQPLTPGSHVLVPDHPRLRLRGSFTLHAWIYATTPGRGVQGIVTKWSPDSTGGYGLFLNERGESALWLAGPGGTVETIESGVPLRSYPLEGPPNRATAPRKSRWCFVAAVFDAEAAKVRLYQLPQSGWEGDPSRAVLEREVKTRSAAASTQPLVVAGAWRHGAGEPPRVGWHFNGKIDAPGVYDRALSAREIELLRLGRPPASPVAAWDFSQEISTRRVLDVSGRALHGRTVNLPMRAVTGHDWDGTVMNFTSAPQQYGAVYFHDDDLDDAGWQADFELEVPAGLASGVYAARLRSGDREEYVPFFVRPAARGPKAAAALILPTLTYLAYGNYLAGVPELISLYDRHTDGSTVAYASRRRPLLLHMRPKVLLPDGPEWATLHGLNGDLYLVSWLAAKGHEVDVYTDEDLDRGGRDLLAPYRVVLTGSHPEYVTTRMLDALKGYLERGGRLMYVGGNGFYWVASIDPDEGHTMEIRRWGRSRGLEVAPGEYYHSTTRELGGLWRFRGRAPQDLVGVGYCAAGYKQNGVYRRQAGSFDPRAAFIFEGIGPDERIGDFESVIGRRGAAGQEVDRADFALGTPAHALVLATATDFSDDYRLAPEESYGGREGAVDLRRSEMVFFETPGGGAVFSVGSINWFGALPYRGYDNNVSRITENVLKRFLSEMPFRAAGRP
jgi:N,N-dimethylformamidase